MPVTLLCFFVSFTLGQADPVFDLPLLLKPPLEGRVLKRTEKDTIVIEEVMFHSHRDGGKTVDIFGILAYPKGAKSAPAFVWNQGGLAQASAHWPEFGAKRGYVVLCIDFPIPGYRSTGGYPINSNVELGDDPRKAPIYHGAVALLRAVSYLESRPEVDRERIGMAGSSWGGFYTTLMVGIDPRLKVGSSMYGAGALNLGNAWWDGQGQNPTKGDAFRKHWLATLDPATRLPKRKTPLAWFTGTNDSFYWLPGVMDSHHKAGGPKHLALLPNWNHALTPEIDEQVFVWLDIHLKNQPAFLSCSRPTIDKGQAIWSWKGTRKVHAAEIYVSDGDPGNWHHRPWRVIAAEITGQTCRAKLPPSRLPGFAIASVTDTNGFRSASPMEWYVASDPNAELPDTDGCESWGGFEENHVAYRRLHGYPVPSLTREAKAGKQAALLPAGKTQLGPVHFIAGEPHRLTAFVKSEKATKITFRLEGRFDRQRQDVQAETTVTTEWSPIALDFTPPGCVSGSLAVVFEVPSGATILVDEIQFRPQSR